MSEYVTRESFELYRLFVALQTHFQNKSYDFHKFSGRTKNITAKALENRKDKYYFYKLSRQKNSKELIFANVLENPKIWIGDLAKSPNSETIYKEWERKVQSLSYTFKEDLSKLNPDFDSNFQISSGHPPIIVLYLKGAICLETLVILDCVTNFARYFDQQLNDPIWKDISFKIMKYKPFLAIDKTKFKSMIIDRFQD